MTEEFTNHPPTSFDVARRVGVSQSTVSLILGGKAAGRVSQRTQEAVLRAAAELGYRPNTAARTLRVGRSQVVALVVPDVGNPYFAALLQGIEHAARQHGYAVVLVSMHDDPHWLRLITDSLAARSVDGVLFHTLEPPAALELAPFTNRAVLLDGSSQMLPSLQLDMVGGTHEAMRHLLRLGHIKIAHLAAAVQAETFRLRRQTYQEALQSAGIPIASAYLAQAPFDIDAARAAAHTLLALPDPPSAIFCDSDLLAVGIYKAARELGRLIPRDLSVVSFDDSLVARILEPELTTVTIPTSVLGEQAVALLLACLQESQRAAPPVISLHLVIRGSTAAPPMSSSSAASATLETR
jgi:DNA-binding LacI/PurR family transcriptional regulator